MEKPSLESYFKGIVLGLLFSMILVGIPMYLAQHVACVENKINCSALQIFSSILSSMEFLLSSIVLIIISIILTDYFSKISHFRKA